MGCPPSPSAPDQGLGSPPSHPRLPAPQGHVMPMEQQRDVQSMQRQSAAEEMGPAWTLPPAQASGIAAVPAAGIPGDRCLLWPQVGLQEKGMFLQPHRGGSILHHRRNLPMVSRLLESPAGVGGPTLPAPARRMRPRSSNPSTAGTTPATVCSEMLLAQTSPNGPNQAKPTGKNHYE